MPPACPIMPPACPIMSPCWPIPPVCPPKACLENGATTSRPLAGGDKDRFLPLPADRDLLLDRGLDLDRDRLLLESLCGPSLCRLALRTSSNRSGSSARFLLTLLSLPSPTTPSS